MKLQFEDHADSEKKSRGVFTPLEQRFTPPPPEGPDYILPLESRCVPTCGLNLKLFRTFRDNVGAMASPNLAILTILKSLKGTFAKSSANRSYLYYSRGHFSLDEQLSDLS